MMQELIQWLNAQNIDYTTIDNEVVEIPNFGKMFLADLSDGESIFKSKDGDVLALGRRVLAFLTYTDEVSTGLDSFRLECINHILRLRAALKKGN